MTTALLFIAAMLAADQPAREAPLSEQAPKRAEALKAGAKTFRLELNYNGEEDKPFYRLIVSVPSIGVDRSNPFYRIVQVSEDQAKTIIDHLAKDGFLDRASEVRSKSELPAPTMPGYSMKAVAGDQQLYEDLGWGLTMIKRLDGLRTALSEAGRKDMDFLLGRLSGLRRQWEAEKPALEGKVGREDSRLRFALEADATVIDIVSPFGIDKASIVRKTDHWPRSILVRLHLGGLESFRAGTDEATLEWSLASTGEQQACMLLWKRNTEQPLPADSPYRTEVRIVGGGKIPLKDGYFEIPLPAQFFEANPQEIALSWVDFSETERRLRTIR